MARFLLYFTFIAGFRDPPAMLCPRTTPARPGGNATPLPAVCSLAPRRNRRFRKSADRGLWVSMLPAGHCLECALFVLAGELLQRVGCAVISHESEAERMERGKGVSQQPTLGRRILGTRTAHPYRLWVLRHRRNGFTRIFRRLWPKARCHEMVSSINLVSK